jgi:hypothetical protein
MTVINIKPMPESYRKISKKFRPMRPPISIFENCGPDGPTPEDIELARELFKLLDEDSKDWYGRHGIFEGL